MKEFMLFLLVALLSNNSAYSQQQIYRLNNYYKGYTINNDGIKEEGFIKYTNEENRYKKIVFKKELNTKKKIYSPKQIKAYKLADKIYHSVIFKGLLGKEHKFLVLEEEGCINKYYYRSFENGEWKSQLVISNTNETISTEIFIFKFSKKMAKFISDNKVLSAKVKNKEKGYRLINFYSIVDEYNTACKNKSLK